MKIRRIHLTKYVQLQIGVIGQSAVQAAVLVLGRDGEDWLELILKTYAYALS